MALWICASVAKAQPAVNPPPNAPATVEWNAAQGRLSIRYHGGSVLDGKIRAEDAAGKAVPAVEVKLEPAETRDPKEKVEQRLKFTLATPQEGVKLVLSGTATGSAEAFAAETEGSAAQKRFPVLRNWNGKLPGGAEYYVRKTRSAGMEPGVWVFCMFYESKSRDYLKQRQTTSGDALRKFYQTARGELGRNVYILSCWGVLPEQIGVVDGCRLATDGFRASSFQGFNSWEGVVWRNDPDHCDVLPAGKEQGGAMKTFAVDGAPLNTIIRPSVVAMAGGVLLLSDKAEVYRDPRNIEGAKRSSPVLFTVPGQLYDYTPRGPDWSFEKSFRDYGQKGGGEAEWWLQEIDRPFEHWSVLARFQWGEGTDLNHRQRRGAPAQEVKFADLGLDPDCEYLVFEFWSQTFLGKLKGSFTAPPQEPNNALQVFAIREARPHPWVISTTRHISQGGVCMLDEAWDQAANILSGTSAVVAGDPYVLTVHLPAGFKPKAAEVAGVKAETTSQADTVSVRTIPSASKTGEWKLGFTK